MREVSPFIEERSRMKEITVTLDRPFPWIGDKVRISCNSLLDGYEGTLVEGPLQNGKFRIEITLFGRKVRLVLDADQFVPSTH